MQSARDCEGSEAAYYLPVSELARQCCGCWRKPRDVWARAKDLAIHTSGQRELGVHIGSLRSLPRGHVQT